MAAEDTLEVATVEDIAVVVLLMLFLFFFVCIGVIGWARWEGKFNFQASRERKRE